MSVQELSPATAHTPAQVQAQPVRAAASAISTSLFDKETLAAGLVLSVALVSHAFNMFNYPLYHQDEGIVSEQAWAFLHNWQLSPYTYAYEHPPVATFMLALWTLLTGGFHTFGSAINSGRVFILVLHLASALFLYRSARNITKSTGAALVTGLLFSLSPLAVSYQRLLTVDNMMVFWLLASLYFTTCNRGLLFRFFGASLTLGLAITTRETAILFLPAFLFLIWRFSHPEHRLYARDGGILIAGLVTVQYLLYALFKSELFPDNFDFQAEIDGKATHVSLVGTLYQNYFHNARAIWDGNSGFASIWQVWTGRDSTLIFGGIICAALVLLFGFKHKENWIVPLVTLGYVGFIGLGGLNADYMVVALVPFLCLGIGQAIGRIGQVLGSGFSLVTVAVSLGLMGFFYIAGNATPYTTEVNQPYRQALEWIKANIPADRSLIIHDALWVDLHDDYNGPAFAVADSHWKAATDPAVYYGRYKGDFKNVDYLLVTVEMREQFKSKGEGFPQQVLENSSLIRQFNGPDALEVRKVNNQKPLLQDDTLQSAYNFYLSHFVAPDGKVSDSKGKTTSAQEANSLQMALWSNDQKTFDVLWNWTAYNLQLDNNLFRAEYSSTSNARSQTNVYTDTRADTDIALALLLAGKRWDDANYTKEALYIIRSIWANEVTEINKKLYLKASAGQSAQTDGEVLLNLGAFSPQAYRLFAEIDKDKNHDWMGLYNSGYDLLQKASWYGKGDYSGIGLPPGLVIMSTDTEELRAVNGEFGARLGNFDEEAQQAMWRIALDYKWNQSPQAQKYLEGAGWFLIKNWEKWQSLAGEYTNNGLPVNGSKSLSSYAVTSAAAADLNEIDLARKRANGQKAELGTSNTEVEIIARAFMGNFLHKDGQGYWWHDDDLNAQQWGWFGTALHMGKLTTQFNQPPASPVTTGAELN
jgi:hypothetical protein